MQTQEKAVYFLLPVIEDSNEIKAAEGVYRAPARHVCLQCTYQVGIFYQCQLV